jgi:uncharacterized protein YggE
MKRTLTTRGSGEASGTPDAMRLTVAVAVRGRAVSEALAGTASGVAAIGEVARGFTTDERITSTGLNVWPAYDNDGRASGYECRHTLSIYCPDLERSGDLVTAIGELGRVLIEGVQPVISDPAPLAVKARERAWTDARAKAEELAALAGATLGEVVSVVEEGGSAVPYPREVAMAAKMDTRFEAGSQAVGASLTVTWALA